ncbi:hypothetical protein SAMD00019534_023560 [Acytostelium subglobosum LB1]|uniref:hypothetical protein n=1 Tax=Acytostelium subglobosum LB1 TaxID=1410327 RepID=UPI0006450299|nr:hypothetical protein SAMD00019534_023560 [Acytostelium subglobosum LB1]GAM19181.1 hypothetical protein SAMD00019534_023560 [Acytostelium subglobosum LB1]|eukprot:XP_012757108.1 hypothetical protein SAMD00019534_023560 [Acytostelium subglobosum LB1]
MARQSINIPVLVISIVYLLSIVVGVSKAQAIEPSQLTSLIWLAKQYKVNNWNLAATECASFATTSVNTLKCDGSDIITITITSTGTNNGSPGGIPYLYFPRLDELSITLDKGVVANQTANLIDLLDNINNVNMYTLGLDGLSLRFQTDFPKFLRPLGRFELYNIKMMSDLLMFPNATYVTLRNLTFVNISHSVIFQSTKNYSTEFMYMEYPSNTPFSQFNITSTIFPKLEYLELTSLDASARPNKINIIQAPLLGDMTLVGFIISPTNLAHLTSLSSFFGSFINLITDLPPLGYLAINNGFLTKFPSTKWMKPYGEIHIETNNISGILPDYTSLHPRVLHIQENPFITGPLPEAACEIYEVKFQGTDITYIPQCFYCYFYYVGDVSNNLPAPMNFKCNYTLDKLFYIRFPGENITITGTNLGYGDKSESAPSNFFMDIPNTRFHYVPSKPNGEDTLIELIRLWMQVIDLEHYMLNHLETTQLVLDWMMY